MVQGIAVYKDRLLERLGRREATIGICGLGYIGLPLSLRYSEIGCKVIGFDIDVAKVAQLNSGASYIDHISSERVESAVSRNFKATSDFSEAQSVDALILCVPTPLGKYREPDLSYVTSTVDSLLPYINKGQVISLESTTYPGTTEEELLPRIQSMGLTVGEDIFLVYSPEREDPGNLNFNTQSTPKICGGHTSDCLEVGVALYQGAVDKVIPVSSTKAAEMTKLLENIHRAVNIGLVNEMKVVADKMGIDIHEVINAAATKPFGFTPYYPGPGLGGHCIPIDPFYLTWKAREYNVNTRFIELAGEVNSAMPQWVVTKLRDALNDQGKALRGSKVLILGVSYKKNVGDTRESPAIEIMDMLEASGAHIQYSDPHVPFLPKMRNYSFDLVSEEPTRELLIDADAVLIVTDHDAFDYEEIKRVSSLVVDTRGRYKEIFPALVKA